MEKGSACNLRGAGLELPLNDRKNPFGMTSAKNMKVRRVLPSQSAKFLSSLLLSSPLHSGNVELAQTGGQLQEGPRIKARGGGLGK